MHNMPHNGVVPGINPRRRSALGHTHTHTDTHWLTWRELLVPQGTNIRVCKPNRRHWQLGKAAQSRLKPGNSGWFPFYVAFGRGGGGDSGDNGDSGDCSHTQLIADVYL